MKDRYTPPINEYNEWEDWRSLRTIREVRAQRPDLVGEVLRDAGFERRPQQRRNEAIVFVANSEKDKRFQNDLFETKSTIESHPSIASARFRHLQGVRHPENDEFALSIELCPLYLPGALDQSQLDPNPQGVESILASRVGKKWIATTHTIDSLAQSLRKQGTQLSIQATFGDKGVLVATENEANESLVSRHSSIYHEALQEFCDDRGVKLNFRNLSEFPEPEDPAHRVGRFVVAEGAEQLDYVPPTEELMQRLGLPSHLLQTHADRKQASVLGHAFGNCAGNMNVWRGLLNTYMHYVPHSASQGNMHLGMERADWLLAIQKFPKGSPLERKPALNIEVA